MRPRQRHCLKTWTRMADTGQGTKISDESAQKALAFCPATR